MAGSSYAALDCHHMGRRSHGKGVGAVIDGCPAGLSLCEEDIQRFLDRREAGAVPVFHAAERERPGKDPVGGI